MRCASCGFENPEEMKYCIECAAPFRSRCPACGCENPPQAKFCGQCAASLREPPSAASSPHAPHSHTPISYTPTHLAEKILHAKAALEGERKQVTVLFADLKMSMELIADRDPEEARRLLDPVLERMLEAVHRYEGTVNQIMGDGIMALFGAPIAHEDHAVRACYAALAMQEAIRRYSDEVRRSHGIEVQVRVGLNSGEVVVRAIGNDLHMDYSAIGQTTHLAARMEQLAPPGSIRFTAATLKLAEGFVQVKSLGPVPVKGLAHPVEVFELLGAGPSRRRLQVTAMRGLSRFVGRQTELDQLHRGLEQAQRGHGQVVAVVGEPGVGKSRLVWECLHSHRTQGWLVLESSSVSYGKATPYLPVIDLLRGYFQIDGRDEPRRVREKVAGKLVVLDEALQPTLPALQALLDMPVDDAAWQALDPPQRRQRTLDAVKRLLLRESQVQPLLVVFEDLHWIDAETQALLDSLIESLPTARMLLLVNYRPEYQHSWGSKTYYTQVRLDPLPPESAAALLQALLGDDPSLASLTRVLMARTQGNPFFLEESVRTLAETGVLVGEPGAYRLAQALPTMQLPATVQAVLAARIDRLPPEEKRLLQTAAVIGTELPFPLLQAIGELPEEALRRGLAHLQAAEFLYEAGLFPELEYTFKHALTHEVAYGSLLQERRRALHGRIVEASERLYPDRLAEQVERLAHHALRGEMWDKALAYCRQAGAKAYGRSALREAVAYFEQALVALKHLPDSRDAYEQAIDLHHDLRRSFFQLGELGRMFDHLRQAETLVEALDDPRRRGEVYNEIAFNYQVVGDYDRALEVNRRALAIGTTLGDLALQVRTHLNFGRTYWSLGEYRRAMDGFRWNVTYLVGEQLRGHFGGSGMASVLSRAWLAMCLAEVGEFPEGIACGEEAARIAEAANHPFSLIRAYVSVGHLYLRKGELHRAIPVLERGLRLCQVANILVSLPLVTSKLGAAYALSGRVAEALPLLEQDTSTRYISGQPLGVVSLGEGYLLAGRMDDAMELADRALELARTHKERGHQAYALRLLADIAARREPLELDQAGEYYRQALALAEELGMRPLLAHCHLGLGQLYAKIGRRAEARTALSSAIELYRAMEMTFWLPQAEAALAQVEGR